MRDSAADEGPCLGAAFSGSLAPCAERMFSSTRALASALMQAVFTSCSALCCFSVLTCIIIASVAGSLPANPFNAEDQERTRYDAAALLTGSGRSVILQLLFVVYVPLPRLMCLSSVVGAEGEGPHAVGSAEALSPDKSPFRPSGVNR
ncbi:hypothetical protein CCR81_04965 [Halorhodospira halophila]|nr:hypothetical protein [Halorhodospira halophila]